MENVRIVSRIEIQTEHRSNTNVTARRFDEKWSNSGVSRIGDDEAISQKIKLTDGSFYSFCSPISTTLKNTYTVTCIEVPYCEVNVVMKAMDGDCMLYLELHSLFARKIQLTVNLL
jgi:hypothetical protein